MNQNIRVELGERSYDIAIGTHLLTGVCRIIENLSLAEGYAVVVSNPTVFGLYGDQLCSTLLGRHSRVDSFLWPDGENHKSLEQLNLLFTHLLERQADRRTVLYALGGGVVGDMTGFAAACYQRGIEFVQIPTTLLSQVDSSVGGKTGVNHVLGKNMIGAFHQPAQVICDVSTLLSLPPREFNSGLAEVIKYGAIADNSFFEWLETRVDALLARDAETLIETVARCCQIKADVVAKDERESGLREILNFGHTFGHAIETGLGYGVWLHGEAVAAGMVMAAELSTRLGMTPRHDANRLRELIRRAQLPVAGPREMTAESYLPYMRVDKKARAGAIRYVLIGALGNASTRPVDDAAVVEAISACLEAE